MRNRSASTTSRKYVPDEDLRRLAAYRMLAARDFNQAVQLTAVT
ncbi:hypothetical protein [Streptomyces lasiicapitis]